MKPTRRVPSGYSVRNHSIDSAGPFPERRRRNLGIDVNVKKIRLRCNPCRPQDQRSDVTAKSLDQLKVASSTTCVPRKSSLDAIVDPQSLRRLLHSERWCRHEGVAAE
jgi:hypothetical protein